MTWLRESARTWWSYGGYLHTSRYQAMMGRMELTMQGRLLHPNNLLPLSKRRRVVERTALGLEPLLASEGAVVDSDVDSGRDSSDEVEPPGVDGDSYSKDVGDTRLLMHLDCESEGFSTDVSDTRRKRRTGKGGVDQE